jgi:single-stranded-DNA-specific exonuclease
VEKKWQILNKSGVSNQESVVKILLKNRGIKNREAFFNPPEPSYLITQLPSYLPDLDRKQLQRAVERVESAVSNGEKIAIWGDYDVDGITATAILWSALGGPGGLGAETLPYIPDRFTEGYGLSEKGIRRLADRGIKLIITVDSGITAREETACANSLGIDVVVTDHHLKPKELPPAYAVVHTDNLCGAGIAWLLASRLTANSEWLMAALDLVAIATVADLQPLLGVNRGLVKYGFEVLNRNKRPGLAALAEVAGLKPGNLGSYAAGWVLGPRINAIGRIGLPSGATADTGGPTKLSLAFGGGMEALRLLCTQDEVKARQLAHLLEKANKERRALTVETFNHAKGLLDQSSCPAGQLVVLYHDSWHEGIIGLVAGKLVEECGRPAVVIAKGEEFSKGSARSVNGFNILEALRDCSDLLEDVGGHEAAAGFTVLNENLERLTESLRRKTAKALENLDSRPVLKIDAELPLQQIDHDLVATLEKFEPCGLGNPQPVFTARGVNVLEERKVGRQKQHLKLSVSPGFEAIWFGHGEDGGFSLGEEVSLVYTPEIDRWDGPGRKAEDPRHTMSGKEKLTLKIHDLKKG